MDSTYDACVVELLTAVVAVARRDAQDGDAEAQAWLADVASVRPTAWRFEPEPAPMPATKRQGQSRSKRLLALARAAGWPERSLFGLELDRLATAVGLTYAGARGVLGRAKRTPRPYADAA